jgi:tetratricopeptide (TPR) repeat protein
MTKSKEDAYSEKLDSEPKINVEKTREIRTKSSRRLMGKVTTKSVSSDVPQKVKEEESIKEDDSIVNPEKQPSVSLESKRVSFIDKEGVALWDSTQEIGKMIQEGNYGRAESDLIDILSKNPRNTEAYRLLGIVYLKRKDFAQAREVFEEALRRDPEHGGLQGPLGFCYMSMGEYGKALSMYQQALNMDENNIEYLEQLLVISARMDRRPLVKMVAKKILAINPNHAEAKKYLERISA